MDAPNVGTTAFGSAALKATFEAAAHRSGGVVERVFTMAGRKVMLRFSGRALADLLTEAFEHLALPDGLSASDGSLRGDVVEAIDSPNDGISLRIHVWDTVSTGLGCPLPPHEGRIGEEAGLRVLWQRPPLRAVLQPGQSSVTVFDTTTGEGWYWCADPARLPFWEPSAPFRMILHWWLGTHGALLAHAAAVGFEDGGTMIVGRGGSGKSTTSLLALRHGLRFASDDYVAVEPPATPGSAPRVHSLFGTAKLTADQYVHFPELHPAVTNAHKLDSEKAVVYLRRVTPHQLVREFPLRAVLVPRITGLPPTTVARVSPAAALAALAPSTIFQLPGTASADFAKMASIVRAVPNYALNLGTDLDNVPAAIDTLLRELG